MIYTATLNPAIDLVIITHDLKPEIVNRTQSFELQPNGKGVNVSFILKKLGVENIATGIGGGFTLDYVCQGLEKQGIKTDFLKVSEPTRVNVFTRVLNDNIEYKEVNPGPKISHEIQEKYLVYLKENVKAGDSIIVSGSFSAGIKPDYIVEIAKIVQAKKAHLIVDTNYPEVTDTIPYHPFLLKPNNEELASWFGKEKASLNELIEMAQRLVDKGVDNILLSLGADGAALINKDHVYIGNAPKIKVVNTACSGDTMLGTFIAYLEKGNSNKVALKHAIAAGSDTASRSGLTDFKRTTELEKQIEIKEGGKIDA